MKIGIFYQENNTDSVRTIRRLKRLLIEAKHECEEITSDQPLNDKIKLIVVFGGDGSVLSAVKVSKGKIPIVAVNTGTVGFLTSFEKDELDELVKAIKNDSLVFSKRKLLSVKCGKNEYYALNDAVIVKDNSCDKRSCCVKLNLSIDGNSVYKYSADGLILSTSTGSTAYALSAGGPIVTPNLEAVTVAPVCAHSLQARPIVFAPTSVAEVSVSDASPKCALYIDGALEGSLSCGESVSVSISSKTVKICENFNNFFDKLSKKISSWTNNE